MNIINCLIFQCLSGPNVSFEQEQNIKDLHKLLEGASKYVDKLTSVLRLYTVEWAVEISAS